MVAVVRRVGEATAEVQIVSEGIRPAHLRPIVAVRANVVQRVIVDGATTHEMFASHLLLHLVRSGTIGIDNGRLRRASLYSDGWSRNAATYSSIGANDAAAYRLEFYADVVLSSHGPGSRWVGFPLRCLAL